VLVRPPEGVEEIAGAKKSRRLLFINSNQNLDFRAKNLEKLTKVFPREAGAKSVVVRKIRC
jgi:hypothetical protein